MKKPVELVPIGPFVLPRIKMDRGGYRLSEALGAKGSLADTDFWKEAAQAALKAGLRNLSLAKGIYVFGLKTSRGMMPYYVGKTEQGTISQKPFTGHNLNKFNACIGCHKGIPVMFFLVLPPRKGKDNLSVIKSAEKVLIEMAFARNPDGLINSQHAKEEKWGIKGVLRPSKGRVTQASKKFKEMLGSG